MIKTTQTQSPSNATLDEVFSHIQNWREHKNESGQRAIPDKIWRKIFELESTGRYSATFLRRTFGLNSQQFKTKKSQLLDDEIASVTTVDNCLTDKNTLSVTHEPQFCEAIVSSETATNTPTLTSVESEKAMATKISVEQLKSTQQKPNSYLNMSTIIVEYIRPDGHRLKIHTTTESIHHVMQSFGAEGSQSL